MTCFRPLKGWKRPKGGISFRADEAEGLERMQVPCGACIGCLEDRSRMWAVRCVHEAQCHEFNSFITLTHDDRSLPSTGSVSVRIWQLFAKRLRKKIGPFRFFACGEYGEERGRPHYHACIFGYGFNGTRERWKKKNGNWIYLSKELAECWYGGISTVQDLTFGSAVYVARYTAKKLGKAQLKGRNPEFVTMSRGGRSGKGGLGSKWFEKYGGDVFPSDECVIDGFRFKAPRYYLDKVGDDQVVELVKARREKYVKDNEDRFSEARLIDGETVLNSKLNLKRRAIR